MDAVIGAVLHNARRKKGLSRHQLTAELNVSETHLTRMESGQTAVPLSHIAQIAKVLDMSCADILKTIDQTVNDLNKKNVLVTFDDRDAEGTMYSFRKLLSAD